MINFRCPKCNDMLSVPESVVGEKENCPCGNVCIIPSIIDRPMPHHIEAKSFVSACVVTFVLYLFGWLPGLIANYLYFESAKKYKRETNIKPEGYGFLEFLSILFGWIPMFLVIAALIAVTLMGLFHC